MLVIASIHQPSTNTLLLFDNVLLLSSGNTVYYGPPANSMRYFISLGHPPPPLLSPAEFMLELSNTNFTGAGRASIHDRVALLCNAWDDSIERKILLDKVVPRDGEEYPDFQIRRGAATGHLMKPFILLHRMAIVIFPPMVEINILRNHIEIPLLMEFELPCISDLQSLWEQVGYDSLTPRQTFKMF
jgi:hypothetical protein